MSRNRAHSENPNPYSFRAIPQTPDNRSQGANCPVVGADRTLSHFSDRRRLKLHRCPEPCNFERMRGKGERRRSGWWLLAFASLAALGGCQRSTDRAFIVPSLRPVDSARPMVVFSQVQGKACGADAVLGALRDMKRLIGVDGYLEVVVHETGNSDRHCAQATAYPYRYGTSTATPVVRAGDEPLDPVLVPGRPAVPAPASDGGSTTPGAVFDCSTACPRYASLVETGSIKVALAKDRCEQRCKQPDATFQQCIALAQDAASAKACSTP